MDPYPEPRALPAPPVPAIPLYTRPPPPPRIQIYLSGQQGYEQSGQVAGQTWCGTGRAYVMEATEAGTSDDQQIGKASDHSVFDSVYR